MLIFKLEKFRLVRNTLVMIERHLTTTIWTRATESLFWMLPFSAVIQYISAQDFSFSCQYVNLNLSASHAISVVCICVTWWCWILVPEKRKGKKKDSPFMFYRSWVLCLLTIIIGLEKNVFLMISMWQKYWGKYLSFSQEESSWS